MMEVQLWRAVWNYGFTSHLGCPPAAHHHAGASHSLRLSGEVWAGHSGGVPFSFSYKEEYNCRPWLLVVAMNRRAVYGLNLLMSVKALCSQCKWNY